MSLREAAISGVRELIDVYTKAPEGRKKKVDVLHADFEHLPKETRQLIEGVLKEVYRGDFEIVRKAFVEKLEFFLRLIADALKEAKCLDTELQERIGATREQIADVVNETEVSEEEVRWLRKIGFLPVDIFELTAELDISGVIAELRANIDEYKLILGDEKYIVKILKMYEGLDKLKRLRSFYRNYNKDVIEFNGSHLAQIVVNAGWEEKLRLVLTESCVKLLRETKLTHNALAKLLTKKDWRKQLQGLGVNL